MFSEHALDKVDTIISACHQHRKPFPAHRICWTAAANTNRVSSITGVRCIENDRMPPTPASGKFHMADGRRNGQPGSSVPRHPTPETGFPRHIFLQCMSFQIMANDIAQPAIMDRKSATTAKHDSGCGIAAACFA